MGAWRLRGYVVEGLLGRGGSGEVWRARVAATGEKVALKRLPVRDDVQIRRAAAEAAKLSVLEHPHLVRLHALVPDHPDVVLVLDLAEGGSLADLLAARGRLTPGEVITAIAPVAAALAHVHAAGVVHGDVTPANILFTAGGNAMLADLGVARLTGEDDDAESTPAYVDPGVALGGIPSELSDVFMVAATALHALTGEVPWPGPGVEDALDQARAGDLGPLPTRLAEAGVPDAMAGVLCRALDRSPGRRGTAAAFALDLRHSGVPVAVELDAGRARREPALREIVPPAPTETRPRGGRHAAVPPARPGRRDRVGRPAGAAAAVTSRRVAPAAEQPAAPGSAQPFVARPVWPAPSFASPSGSLGSGPSCFDRPSFSRPVAAPAGAPARPGAPPPTSRVAPRPRPQLPRPRQHPDDRQRRAQPTTVGIALAVAVVLALAGLLLSRHLDTSARAQPPAGPAAHTTSGSPSSSSRSSSSRPSSSRPNVGGTSRTTLPGTSRTTLPGTSRTTLPGTSRPTGTATSVTAPPVSRVPPTGSRAPALRGWPARLAALDALRGRAFAERRPDLLRGVYASAALLQADTTSLLRIVPTGCGLHGVRTTYRDVRVTETADRAVVTVQATLPPSTLMCGATARGQAAGVGPTRMRLTLVGPAASARIAEQERV